MEVNRTFDLSLSVTVTLLYEKMQALSFPRLHYFCNPSNSNQFLVLINGKDSLGLDLYITFKLQQVTGCTKKLRNKAQCS